MYIISIVVKICRFTSWYSHCVSYRLLNLHRPPTRWTARLLDAVTVFGGELDSLGDAARVWVGNLAGDFSLK